jgi:HEAT repeat protein
VRKRIPRVLAHATTRRAVYALQDALGDEHLAVRYHAARALRALASRDIAPDPALIWEALRIEITQSLPLWEAQRLVDEIIADDPALQETLARRGAAGLRHAFNLLALVVDPDAIDLAYRAVTHDDAHARAVALEYLEHVVPSEVCAQLWPYIGDDAIEPTPVSQRAVNDVLDELRRNSRR